MNPEEVFNELDNSILLCYEDNLDFCHRHIVAAWFELLLGVTVPEQKADNNKIKTVEKPQYIKKWLEEILENNKKLIS